MRASLWTAAVTAAGVPVPPQLKDEKFSPKSELIDWSRTLESETISERGRKDEAAAAASD